MTLERQIHLMDELQAKVRKLLGNARREDKRRHCETPCHCSQWYRHELMSTVHEDTNTLAQYLQATSYKRNLSRSSWVLKRQSWAPWISYWCGVTDTSRKDDNSAAYKTRTNYLVWFELAEISVKCCIFTRIFKAKSRHSKGALNNRICRASQEGVVHSVLSGDLYGLPYLVFVWTNLLI